MTTDNNYQWISVADSPLYTIDEKGNWICTEAGDKPFIAALQYTDKKRPGKQLWWVMPCIVEDGRGLCIIGDEENVIAGWDLTDVTHYKPLDLTPPKEI